MTEPGEADEAAPPLTRRERLRRVVILCEELGTAISRISASGTIMLVGFPMPNRTSHFGCR